MQGKFPGKFIVFEGVEGCGKTTQLRRSQEWLSQSGWLDALRQQGAISHLLVTREPGGTEVGTAIRQLLLNPETTEPIHSRAELLLYAADRAQHVEHMLKPELAAGALILCDRFTDSTLAYQGYGRGIDRDLINQLNQVATHGLQSNLTIWLDLAAEIGLSRTQRRGQSDRIEQSSLDFHRRVQQGFTDLAKQYPQRIVRVDASLSQEEVSQCIQGIFQQRLSQWFPPLSMP